MKAGTAQKLVLNMISTGAMIRIGKVYKNLMVDMTPVNQKLVLRSIKIIKEAAGCPFAEAEKAFIASGKKTKTAIVMLLTGTDREKAEALLRESDGHIGAVPGIG
jgi:N-acetylmuramic acid 6-phosphate etherase